MRGNVRAGRADLDFDPTHRILPAAAAARAPRPISVPGLAFRLRNSRQGTKDRFSGLCDRAESALSLKGPFNFSAAMMACQTRVPHAADGHRHRGRRACRLARCRHAGARRHQRRPDRSAHRLSAGFPLREDRRRADADAATRPASPTRSCAPRPSTAASGSRASAAWSTSGRATSTASSTTTWSTRCAAKSRERAVPARQGHRRSRPATTASSVTLSTGEEISARLVVLANGLNIGLRHKLGIVREDLSKTHSIMLGFDLDAGRPASVRVPGADLLRRAADRPHRLHHAVPDRRHDARQPVRLSRHGRSVAARVPRRRRARRCAR